MNMTINDSSTKTVEVENKKEEKIVKIKPEISLKPKRKLGKKIIIPLIILAVAILGFIGYKALEFSDNIGIKINPGDIISNIKEVPKLKRDSTEKYTTALVVGIDTRSEKSTLKNTDSLILATYNHDTKNLTMISIPRDFYVEVPNEGWYTKVNALYAHGEALKKGDGMNYLAKALTRYTGLEIQYKAMVDLQGFITIINSVGGVTVNVENAFTDYCYPAGRSSDNPHYCASLGGLGETISFEKGPQTMTGNVALKFARSRHSQGVEGSDFARAKRQQKILIALKDKVLSSETLLNPQKVMEILDAIKNNVKLYGIETNDIQAGINLAKEYQKDPGKSYSFVIEPSFGNYSILRRSTQAEAGELYAIVPKAGINDYSQIKGIVKLCLTRPALYSENPKIRVYDIGIGSTDANAKVAQMQKKFPYIDIVYMGALYKNKEGTIVYPHSKKFSSSAIELAKWFDTESITQPEYITTNLNGEDITVLLGKPIIKVEEKE